MDFEENFRALFYPESIAMIGASNQRNKWGYRILNHIISGGFTGRIFPINPKEKEIYGMKTFPNIRDVPDVVDLVIIVVPKESVEQCFEDCINKGVKAAVLITAGLGETNSEGKDLERTLAKKAREGGMIFTGPNCNGLLSAAKSLYAWMLPIFPSGGSISMVTQSGNIGSSILARGVKYNIGFSKYISSGNEACVRTEDVIEFYGRDPETKVIITYIEGIKNGQKFFDVCKRVSLQKPILLLKSGRTGGGARAAQSHTGSIAGDDVVFDAACRQAGVIRCDNLDEIFDLAVALLVQPLPRSPRVGIVTSGGGWGVLASDACEKRGLDIAQISEESIHALDKVLPQWWNRGNPIDLVAGVQDRSAIFDTCISTLFENGDVDSIILLGMGIFMVMQKKDYTLDETEMKMIRNEARIADVILKSIKQYGCPVIPATDLNRHKNPDEDILINKLKEQGILMLSDPDRVAAVLAHMHERFRYLHQHETG